MTKLPQFFKVETELKLKKKLKNQVNIFEKN